MIKVKLPSAYQKLAASHHIELNGMTNVRHLLSVLCERFPQLTDELLDSAGQPELNLLISINGEPLSNLQGWDTNLMDGDEVDLYLLLAGG
ncbi:MAG: MoaD/ThiS family protein [bacterium]|nr:MoaD/ThiS family protein [bacterium]